MLRDKTLERLAAHPDRNFLDGVASLNGRRLSTWRRLKPKFLRLVDEMKEPRPEDWRTIHGDLVFSNVLADGLGGHFLVDPRGSYGGLAGARGDRCYDYAKLAQCLDFHYDGIKKDEFELSGSNGRYELRFPLAGSAGRRRWRSDFRRSCRALGVDERRVRFFSVTLLLSLLPLHASEPAQARAAALLALEALDSL
jgi:hypothetical protein